ncbi:elongation of fatty acids protein [Aspergillus arachidicola]|uniref:Elongation of fatty acids protein n=1 Tax=Aspergillus arachidicola TaxID=656916 RepID=A0A2G7G480_9EURO|nr:elongation of fatty acids protein [Aspergillus arachidicola]
MAIESFPIPSLDRPFGVHLWPHFSKAFELVAGYPADEFKFVVGTTPMSTLRETSIFVAVYYTVISGGREVMRNRAPFKLRSLFLIHNFYLTAISAILLALYIEELVPTIFQNGIFYAICHRDGGWTNRLVVLYYLLPCSLHLFYFATYNKDGKPPSTRRTLRRMSQAEVNPKATGIKTGNASVRARKVLV